MTPGSRAGPWVATGVLALSFMLFAMAGVYTVRQQHRVDDQLCAQAVEGREGLRRTWMAAETFILRSATSQEAAVRTREFFQAVLTTIPPIQCVDRKPVEVE